jgi:hypothetical protein
VILGAVVLSRAKMRVLSLVVFTALAVSGVLACRGVLSALEGRARPVGSEYDLPLREKRAVCEAILDRELELVRFPRFEYPFLLEEVFRERSRLAPTLALRFEHHDLAFPHWEIAVRLPRPKKPRGHAIIGPSGELAPVSSGS